MPSNNSQKLALHKQKEIPKGSFREFTEYGYDMASANRITRKLVILRGVLFRLMFFLVVLIYFIIR